MLATLVSYCSLERAFIGDLVRNAVKFSDVVVVSIGTRLYKGPPEDVEELFKRDILSAVSDPEDRAKLHLATYGVPMHIPSDMHTSHFHDLARLVGFRQAQSVLGATKPDFWVLFLDADEVPDGDRFKTWLDLSPGNLSDTSAMYKFSNYWAFLHPRLVSEDHEDSVFMAHSSLLTRDALMHPRERDGIYLSQPQADRVRLLRNVVGIEDSFPMFWHYSWVRGISPPGSEAELREPAPLGWLDAAEAGIRAKVRGWGHRGDRDWESVISETFQGMRETRRWPERDFVHGHRLKYEK